MTCDRAIVLLSAISCGAIGFALVSQYVFHYPPCELCILQRIAHGAIMGSIVGLLFTRRARALLIMQAIFIAICLGLSLFHIGVENHLWEGTRACTGEETHSGMSIADLTAQILSAPVVRCDDVRWNFLGLSMAVWDAILTGTMLAFAGVMLARKR